MNAYSAPARSNSSAQAHVRVLPDERAGIFGAASAYRRAKQLGRSVAVAEKQYVDVVRDIQRARSRRRFRSMQIEYVISVASTGTILTLDVRRNRS